MCLNKHKRKSHALLFMVLEQTLNEIQLVACFLCKLNKKAHKCLHSLIESSWMFPGNPKPLKMSEAKWHLKLQTNFNRSLNRTKVGRKMSCLQASIWPHADTVTSAQSKLRQQDILLSKQHLMLFLSCFYERRWPHSVF